MNLPAAGTFKVAVQLLREVSVARHQMLGGAHAESEESAAAVSVLYPLCQELIDIVMLENNEHIVEGPIFNEEGFATYMHFAPYGELDVVYLEWRQLCGEKKAAAHLTSSRLDDGGLGRKSGRHHEI